MSNRMIGIVLQLNDLAIVHRCDQAIAVGTVAVAGSLFSDNSHLGIQLCA